MIAILCLNDDGDFNEFAEQTPDFGAYFRAVTDYITEQYAISSGYEYAAVIRLLS